jgi:predicted Zn-dependent protease
LARDGSTRHSYKGGADKDRYGIACLGKRAIDKASQAQASIDLDPGKYTVILEPSAVADLLRSMLGVMEARVADEGRRYFSKKAGGSKLGEKLFDERVTIYSDPNDPVAPESVFGEDGLPQRRTIWIERGVVKTLCYSRFWAKKWASILSPSRGASPWRAGRRRSRA